LRRGRITLVNPLNAPRKVWLSMHLKSADGKPHSIKIGTDTFDTEKAYHQTFDIPALRPFSIDLVCDCPAVRPTSGGRVLYFFVSDVEVQN
jgi:hypothetical protein